MKASVLWASILAVLSGVPVENEADGDGLSWVTSNWEINCGRPFTIEWTGNQGPVTVVLVEANQEESNEERESLWETTCEDA